MLISARRHTWSHNSLVHLQLQSVITPHCDDNKSRRMFCLGVDGEGMSCLTLIIQDTFLHTVCKFKVQRLVERVGFSSKYSRV